MEQNPQNKPSAILLPELCCAILCSSSAVSNQKMNEYLVEIAELSDVTKTLGNRIAKRTFATTVTLMNGVPIESVSKMLGHTNLRTTQLYAKILDEKVGNDMAPLREMFAGSPVVAVKAIEGKISTDKILAIDATDHKVIADVAILREKFQTAV
jgi:N-acyl-D-aspartate/D-glutamate deacylase